MQKLRIGSAPGHFPSIEHNLKLEPPALCGIGDGEMLVNYMTKWEISTLNKPLLLLQQWRGLWMSQCSAQKANAASV